MKKFRESFFRVRRKDTLGQLLEPRIASEGVEPSVDLDAAEDAGVERCAILVAPLQQPQRVLFVAQRDVDNSECIG
jgi:hypothetical protein